ncbi:MAG: sialidase family protein [Verrucomicrobiota bacterium]|jgi:predicted neuraminidase
MKLFRLISLLPALSVAAAVAFPEPCEVRREFIYMVAPFPECHASTLVQTPEGLVASWFGGTREKHPDVGIWVSRQVQGEWTTPQEVANGVQTDGSRHPTWNPVLHAVGTNDLVLFYKVGPNPEKWWGMMRRSRDQGRTWGEATRLPEGILGPVRNRAVTLSDGTLLAGSSTEEGGWRVHFERSRDGGTTWERTADLGDPKTMGLIQPGLALMPGDRVLAYCRSRVGRVFVTESTDGGRQWSEPKPTALPNPNSGIDAITLRDGRILVVYNHTGGNWGSRSPLNVAVSRDGTTWQEVAVLENEPGGEFSYPAVIQTADGRVHVTYTWKRQRIRHVVLDPQLFAPRPLPPMPPSPAKK